MGDIFKLIWFELLVTLLTIASYIIGRWIFKKTKLMIFHTLIVAIAFLLIIIKVFNIDVLVFEQNSRIIKFCLDLSVVSFGYLLYKHKEFISKRLMPILLATFTGSVMSLIVIGGILIAFRADDSVLFTMLPKSVTAPMAIPLSSQYGGYPALTVAFTVLGGMFGALAGPGFLKLCGFSLGYGVGLAMGSAAHGIGTARALEIGEIEGTASALAIALIGIFTSLIYPFFIKFVTII